MDLHEIKAALRSLSGDQLREVLAEFTGGTDSADRQGFLAELAELSDRDDQVYMG